MEATRAPVLLAIAALTLVGWLLLRGGAGGGVVPRPGPLPPASQAGDARTQPADPGRGARGSIPAEIEIPREVPGERATPGTLEVLVRHSDGQPAEGIELRAVAGGELLGGARTDALGRARLDVPERSLELFALTPVGRPAKAAVRAGARHVELALDDRSEVSGRVLVDGEVPATPLEIALLSSRQPRLPSGVPPAAREAFMQAQTLHPGRTGADGRFHFRVPRDFRGQISFPGHRWYIEGERFLEQGPRTGILLRLTSWPVLRGRLLATDGLTPLAGGGVSLVVPPGEPEARSSREARFWIETGADGRFELPFATREAVVAELAVWGPGGEGPVTRAIAVRPDADADAGDVVLEPHSPLPAHVEVAPEPTTRLELDFAPGEVARSSPLVLVLSSAEPVFEDGSFRAGLELSWGPRYFEVLDRRRVVPPPERTEVQIGLAGRDVPAEGGLRAIEGLPPATPLDLRVSDPSGAALWSAEHVVLQPGEPRRFEVRLAPPRPLSVVVLAPDGEPAPQPTVYVMVSDGARELRVGPAGDLESLEVRSASVDVFAFAEGLAPRLLRDVAVPEEGLELAVELRVGRAVEVEVLDPAGERVGGTELVVLASIPGLPLPPEARGRVPIAWVESREPGLFVLEGMSSEPFEVVLLAGGRAFVREIEAGSARAVIPLPAPGALAIAWSAATRPEAELHVVLDAADPSAEDLHAVEGTLDGPLVRSVRADDAGVLEPLAWPGVYPGRYELRVSDEAGAELEPRALEVRPGETVELELAPPAPR